jgi:hypothetical protein
MALEPTLVVLPGAGAPASRGRAIRRGLGASSPGAASAIGASVLVRLFDCVADALARAVAAPPPSMMEHR